MARVVAFIPDLLFGSNVLGALGAAGHDVVLVGELDSLRRELEGADALVVDLTSDVAERLEYVRLARPAGVRTLAFYSHVETDVRELGVEAGLDLVVPRSRMAREGTVLLGRLLS